MSSERLVDLLQPYQGKFPSTEAEFNALQLTLRRMGHILENTHGNVASQLRGPGPRGNSVAVGWEEQAWNPGAQSSGQEEQQTNPWQEEPGSWPIGGAMPGGSATQPYGLQGRDQTPQAYHAAEEVDSGTDTDTVSGHSWADEEDPQIAGLSLGEADEHVIWQYQIQKTHGANT